MSFKMTVEPFYSKVNFCKEKSRVPFPFSGKNITYSYNARIAIYHGVRLLGLKPGDRVLVPAFSCGSEIDALVAADLKIEFYRIKQDLSPDITHLDELLNEKASALFIIHYFGFPQKMKPLLSFSKKHDLLLIEDCAHGLYSMDDNGHPIGSLGDMSVFSLKKQLPIPDGGILVLNDSLENENISIANKAPGFKESTKRLIKLSQREIGHRFSMLRNLKRSVKNEEVIPKNRVVPIEKMTCDLKMMSWRMSGFSQFILNRIDHLKVYQQRLDNFKTIEKIFEGGDQVERISSARGNTCCPWFYPVFGKDPDALGHYLISKGVPSHRFWWKYDHPLIPVDEFSFEASLKKHVMALPLHQDLKEEEMIYIANLLNEWNLDRE